jgi:hypothetical protein
MRVFFVFFYNLIRFIEKQNTPQDAALKALQFTKNSLFLLCIDRFQKKSKIP